MKHFGDITKLHGAYLPVVDVITGGSPCQDLSVAGKRAGLAGERSGLFLEMIRVIKEMREHDRELHGGGADVPVRPRFIVWENVPGALSSNKGADFQAVLTEFVRIAEPEAPAVPMPAKGKWPKSGCLYDELGGWSVAWRLHDAQFWGVPQRRKRIALLADFGGLAAAEIHFERKGLCWYPTKGEETGKDSASKIGSAAPEAIFIQGNCIDRSDNVRCNGRGWNEDVSYTLNTIDRHGVYVQEPLMIEMTSTKNTIIEDGISPTLTARMGTDGNQVNCVFYAMQGFADYKESDIASSCKARDYKDNTDLVMAVDCRNFTESEINGTLQAKPNGGQSLNTNIVCRDKNTVRRETPLECERLQGFPDGWTDIGEWIDSKGKKHKDADSPRYRALGNSIALPYWKVLARRIAAQYDRDITMGSLFDGISGFPLAFQHCGATAVWASEIDEFCIAVSRKHFPEENENET